MDNPVSVLHGKKGVEIYESNRYLVSGLSETVQGYELSLIQYDQRIYDTTRINEIPKYTSRMSPHNPIVHGGIHEPDTRPYDGRDANGIKSIAKKYQATSANIKPPQEWDDPIWKDDDTKTNYSSTNKYLWSIVQTVYTSGHMDYRIELVIAKAIKELALLT